jgi:hypothetical protein
MGRDYAGGLAIVCGAGNLSGIGFGIARHAAILKQANIALVDHEKQRPNMV